MRLEDLISQINEDEETETQISKEGELTFSLEELEKTAGYIKKISIPDREIDKMAKIAVLADLGLIKESSPMGARARAARRAMGALQKERDVIKLEQAAKKLEEGNKLLESGESPGSQNFKRFLIGAGLLGGGGIIGSNITSAKNKAENKNKLTAVARHYYNLGKTQGVK